MALLLELPAAIGCNDFDGFRCSLMHSRKGFKAVEMSLQPDTSSLIERLQNDRDIAVTMSSTGPTLMVVYPEGRDPAERLNLEQYKEWRVISGTAANGGRIISTSRLIDS
jgi:predicted sugar kinase